MPMKMPMLLLFNFTHSHASVLYVKPHALMSVNASSISGHVAHMKSAHRSADSSVIGMAHSVSSFSVG